MCTCAAKPPVGKLIALLEDSQLIEQAAPRSPTTKIQGAGGEVFDLSARLRRPAAARGGGGRRRGDAGGIPTPGAAWTSGRRCNCERRSPAGRRAWSGSAGVRRSQHRGTARAPWLHRHPPRGPRRQPPRGSTMHRVARASASGPQPRARAGQRNPPPGVRPHRPPLRRCPRDRAFPAEGARRRRRPPNRRRHRQPLAMRRCRQRRRRTRTNRTDGHARAALAAATVRPCSQSGCWYSR